MKTLEIAWHPVQDLLNFSSKLSVDNRLVTKRTILSSIASMFEPLGLIAPVIIRGKILMKELWKLKSDWDDIAPPHIRSDWIRYQNDLINLKDIFI